MAAEAGAGRKWYGDWHRITDPRWRDRWIVAFEDDITQAICGHGVFETAASANSAAVLIEAVKSCGAPASVTTDRATSFYANNAGVHRQRGATKFEEALAGYGIRHVLVDGDNAWRRSKIGEFFAEFRGKSAEFGSVDQYIEKWNEGRVS